MKRLFSIILIFAAALLQAWALSADEVLKNSSKALTSGNGVTASFIAVSDGGSPLKGSFTMAGKKFALVTPEYASWYNGENLWSFSDQTGETSLSIPSEEELLEINPFEIISQYSRRFSVKSAKAPEGKAAVALVPKGKDSSVERAIVTVSKSTWLPSSIVIEFSSGQSISVEITSISKPSAPIGSAVFEYPLMLYQGVEVIDLR
ncbi:MAG: hypothetical protein NC102_09475 [Clostridium sp.]|nr:hypothetical protein [Clostridium sp.]